MFPFEVEAEWLKKVCAQYPPQVEGDDLGTTFESVGTVLLAAALLDTESTSLVALLTGLPNTFVDLIFNQITEQHFRSSAEWCDLVRTILTSPDDLHEMRDALEVALESFWKMAEKVHTDYNFTAARAGRIFGGGFQHWVDDEELQVFLSHPPAGRKRGLRKRR